MSWITVQKYSLDKDLAKVHQALLHARVPNRVIEYNGYQQLQVPSAELLEPVQKLLEDLDSGLIEVVAVAKDQPDAELDEASASTSSSLLNTLAGVYITTLLLVLSGVGYALVEFAPLSQFLVYLTFTPLALVAGQLIPGPLEDTLSLGEYWRFITPAFIHFSILHLVFNGLWTWEFSRRIEKVQGRLFTLLFFVFAAIGANLCQYYWSDTPQLFGGMSGVVYAWLGYLAVRQELNPHPALTLPRGLVAFMLGWLVICVLGVVDYFMASGVANGAHVGGLVMGVLTGLVYFILHPKVKS